MKKLLLFIALLFVSGVANAELWIEPKEGGPVSEKLAVYNTSGSALDEGDVVIWAIADSTGDNDLWVTQGTAAETGIVAGVIGQGGIGIGGIGTLITYGHATCDMTSAVASSSPICTASSGDGGKSCTLPELAYAISSAAIAAGGTGACFVIVH